MNWASAKPLIFDVRLSTASPSAGGHGESVRRRRRRKKRIAECGLTRDLPIARSPHHATNAVYPAASPHAVLRTAECGREQYSSEEFVELVVRTDPCPRNRVATAFANCAISVADSD